MLAGGSGSVQVSGCDTCFSFDAPLKAMLVDSKYDQYLGVICIVRIVEGTLKKGDRIRILGKRYTIKRTSRKEGDQKDPATPKSKKKKRLSGATPKYVVFCF